MKNRKAPTPPTDIKAAYKLFRNYVYNAKIVIKGSKCTKAQVYTLDGSNSDIKPQAPVDVTAGVIGSKLPAVSAALFVCGG